MIWIRISDPRSVWIMVQGTGESTLVMDSPVLLMHHDPDRSWITDPDPDHPKGTHPNSMKTFSFSLICTAQKFFKSFNPLFPTTFHRGIGHFQKTPKFSNCRKSTRKQIRPSCRKIFRLRFVFVWFRGSKEI